MSGMIRWKTSRAPASSPARYRPTMSTRISGKPNPVIVPTAPRRSSSSSMIAPRPPRIRNSGRAASRRPTFGGLGSSSSLMTWAFGARSAIVVSSPTDIVTPLLAGGSPATTRRGAAAGAPRETPGAPARVGRAPRGGGGGGGARRVRREDRVVGGTGRRGGREHDRGRARVGGLPGVRDRAVGGRVRAPDADREVAGCRDPPADDCCPLRVGQLGGLA